MNKYLVNWKTTSAGVLAIIGGLTRLAFAIRNKDLTEESIATVSTGILGGIGLIFARDYNKSSEDSGVTPPAPPTPPTPPAP